MSGCKMSEFKRFDEFQQGKRTDKISESQVQKEYRLEENSSLLHKVDFTKEKQKKRRSRFYLCGHRRIAHNNIKIYLLLGTAFLFLILMALLFLPLPFGHIELKGNQDVTMENVIFEGAIKEPVNTLQISTATVKDRLSKDLRIENVEIARKFPGTIVINIQERKNAAAIQTEFGYVIVDKEGLVIKNDTSIKNGDYLMITGKKLGNVLLGDQIEESDVIRALRFISCLSEKGVEEFSEINIGNPENFVAYTRDGISVRLGNTEDLEEQAVLAENMVNDVKARNLSVEYLDANVTNPFIKLKK